MKTILQIVVMLMVAVASSRAGSQPRQVSFEVSGSLSYTFYGRGNGSTNQLLPFKMVVSGDKWQIQNFAGNGCYLETTYDGVSIFHFWKSNVVSFRGRYDFPENGYGVDVESGPTPSGSYPVEIPWFVYASSMVVRTAPVDLPAPWLDPRTSLLAHSFKSKISASTNPPYLPESATFVLAKERADKAYASPWLDTQDLKIDRHWQPLEPYGFVGARYRVLAVTNIHGLVLPTSFELVKFRPSSNKPTNEIYSGTNIVIKEVVLENIGPTKPDRALNVRDFRFQNQKVKICHLDYATKDWILSPQSEELKALFDYRSNDRHFPLTFVHDEHKPVLFYVLFMLVVVSPLLFIVYRWKRARQIVADEIK